MAARAECLVMAKPAGPACNLRCGYCYYLSRASLFPAGPRRMGESLLERYIVERLEVSPGPVTHFEWHGGEPTLMGLDYFRTIIRLQRAHAPAGRTFSNGLQTNGLLLDAAWADFLAKEGFSVGLSIDGPQEFHDRFRRAADGRPTHERAVAAYRLLRERGVFCNVLCVLHSVNTVEPDKTYDFFRSIGAAYLQFLPLTGAGRLCAGPQDIGAFLCRVFDRWIREDVGRIVVQIFDEALRPLYGMPHALCLFRPACGEAAVLEHDGSFYACDHFADPQHLIGNIRDKSLRDLASDPAMKRFGAAKRDSLPRQCRQCGALAFCNGGCPKDRTAFTADGEPGLNVLCPAFKALFFHAKPELMRLAEHMKSGRRLREFAAE